MEVDPWPRASPKRCAERRCPIWDKIFTHPFLREVQAGTLATEKFRGYIVQDYHYLERPLDAEMFELVEISEEEAMRVEPSPTNRGLREPHAHRCLDGRRRRGGRRTAALPVDLP